MKHGWWDHSPDKNERLARAFGYPYHIPAHSYLVMDQDWRPLDAEEAVDFRKNRTPVLAVGSNQSPEQILRKFQGSGWGPIACEKCTLFGFDTVFSAHITSYGSIAAALHPSPGTLVHLFVNWLDDAHLEAMHPTELGHENYVFARLKDIDLSIENGPTLSEVYFYRGNAGAFAPEGDPIPLAEVSAPDRIWKAMAQNEIQSHLMEMISSRLSIDDFILTSISDKAERDRRRARMEKTAKPFDHPHDVLLGTDKLRPTP